MKYWKLTFVLYLFSVIGYAMTFVIFIFYPSFYIIYKNFLVSSYGMTYAVLCEFAIFFVIIKTIIFWNKNDKKAINLILIIFLNLIFIPIYYYNKILPFIRSAEKR